MAAIGTFDRALAALRLVQVDPGRAAALAEKAHTQAVASGDLHAASVAERARGLAAVHVQDLTLATRHLRSAITLARRAGSDQLAAEARMTFAFALNRRGQPRRALAEIGSALADLDSEGYARGLAQRGAILQQLGQLDEAVADYRAALPALRRADDLVWVQRVLSNRGVLHAFRHDYTAASRDLDEAEQLCEQLQLPLPAAFVQENLVLVHRRLGDVPRALDHLRRAERLYSSVQAPIGSLLIERSELLLSVRLFAEAREAAQEAVAEFERTHRRLSAPEARLLLARTAALSGDAEQATREARTAVRQFGRQGRQEWVVLARCVLLLARVGGGSTRRVSTAELVRAADDAEAAGWPTSAREVRLKAGLQGLRDNDPEPGRRQLFRLSQSRRSGPAAARADAWLATALLRQDTDDRRGAMAAAAQGLRVIEDYRGTLVATDLRARVSGLGVELARLGLRGALAGGSPRQVLAWAEKGRARHLLERPALPAHDPEVAHLLAEMRAVDGDIREQRRLGQPVGRLMQRELILERAIRDATRRRPAEGESARGVTADGNGLETALGEAALLEFVELDGQVYAVCLAQGRATKHWLGSLEEIRRLVRWLPFALLRLSRNQTRPESGAAAVALLRHTAAQLDALLLGPMAGRIGARPLVVVPTGPLQSMPWSLLPSCRGRPITLAPSAAMWEMTSRRHPVGGHVVVVEGPGLPGAHQEAEQVAAIYGIGAPMREDTGTVEAVARALSGAALAHVAAHGTVRADNPLFSSLSLSDGPLTVYDLERLDRGADTVVLAACESARDVVLAGDELIGLSAAFLGRDTRQVVASVVAVPDAETAPLMVSLHRKLAGGADVATALSAAQAELDAGDPATLAAAAGFVCIGDGFASLPSLRA